MALLALLPAVPLSYAQTDIANKPIAGTTTVDVKPNIMLLMDTSQSMGFSHMPDDIDTLNDKLPIGYKSYQCNTLYYNPNTTYGLPKDAYGVNLATPTFTAARYNYYSTDTSTKNLGTQFQAYDNATRDRGNTEANDTPQAAYYYVYSGSEVLKATTLPCTQPDVATKDQAAGFSTAGEGTWTRILVGASEQQNFANWYTYYRTRMAMAKTSVGLAFAPITSRYRVGFVTANPGVPVAADKYLAIADFTSANKAAWYAKVNAQVPGGSSPMREGLARVGRHYAGKQDGINKDMAGDPVQYACQKNYTLMTTDGYWNVGSETAGPVQLDGTTLVGNQDGAFTGDSGYTPYGVWDGGNTSTRVTTNKFNTYTTALCDSGYRNKSTAQITKTETRTFQNTTQALVATQQNLQSTSQINKSTTQTLQSTSITKKQTKRTDATVTEVKQSTAQTVDITTWVEKYTITTSQTQTQRTKSTTQNLKVTQQMRKATTQNFQTKQRQDELTSQPKATVTQNFQSTSQTKVSTSRQTASTQQWLQSTSRTDQTVTQTRQSTSQLNSYDGSTERSTPTASCTPGGNITCYTVTTTNVLVASCTAASTPNSGNNYTVTTCATTTVSGPTPVQTCSAIEPVAGNNFQKTTCTPVTTAEAPIAVCASPTATSGNSWTTSVCRGVSSGPTPVPSPCSNVAASAGNSYVATTCSAAITTGPTPISAATCSNIAPTLANSYTTTTCTNYPTGPTAVQTCAASGPSGPNWITTTCNANPTNTVAVQSCTAQTATSTNNWVGITCPGTVTTGPTPVATCTLQTGSALNNWITRTCPAVVVTSPRTAVASCTPVTATGPGFIATVCDQVTFNDFVPYASCTNDAGLTAPDYIKTVCTSTTTTTNAGIPNTCAVNAGTSYPYLSTSCPTPVNTGPTNVASCTAGTSASPNFVVTTCADAPVSGPTVMACTVGSSTSGTGLTTTCTQVTSATTIVQPGTCVAGTVGGVTTFCTNRTATTPMQAGTCVDNPGTSAPWVKHVCQINTTGPTAVATCAPVTAVAPSWTATTCSAIRTVSGPTAVDTTVTACPAGFNATTGFTTTCTPVNSAITAVDPTTCTNIPASSTNNYTATVCTFTTTGPTGVNPSTCTTNIAPTSGNGWKTTTCAANNTGPTPAAPTAAGCTAAVGGSGNQWRTTLCPATTTGPTPVETCTPITAVSPNWVTTSCSVNNTPPTPTSACSRIEKSAGNNYVLTTCTTSNTGPTVVAPNATNCPANPNGGAPNYIQTTCTTPAPIIALTDQCQLSSANVAPYVETACSTLSTGPDLVPVANCTAAAALPGVLLGGNNYTSTSCDVVNGNKFQIATTTSVLTEYLSGSTVVTNPPSEPPVVTTTTATDVDGMCYAPGVAVQPATPTAQPTLPTGCSGWPCVVNSPNVAGGSTNSLADVAQYYYVTDLRTGPGFENPAATLGTQPLDDSAPWQHMTTFALGLGVSGTLNYQSDYMTSPTGDFSRIRPPVVVPPAIPPTATLNWPAWPNIDTSKAKPYDDPRSIDDFWHAAVDGRGRYFSASNTAAVVDGLAAALNRIDTEAGSGGGAGLTTSTPVANNNQGFITSFKTKEWTGNVTAQKIDVITGTISSTQDWSAQDKLDALTFAACDNRTIVMRKAGATNNLTNFSWNTKACVSGLPAGAADTGLDATQQAMFGSVAVASLGQYPTMTNGGANDQRVPAAGANMVNFIRGQRGFEVPTEAFVPNNPSYLYRKREHVLGDIVGSVATFVGSPGFSYADTGYGAYKTANAARTPMIYVGANDGMLHAIYAPIVSTDPNYANAGAEAWAYVPQAVIPNLYQLADVDYKANHRFFVDGTPAYGDVYDTTASAWKTILVGGLNAGGKSYYALDVSDPVHPKSLWEFSQGSNCFDAASASTSTTGTDCHLGLSFGRPIITKLVDGTWVVLLTSGYNNMGSPTGSGDGHGYLYVLNAITGQIISKLDTGVGTSTSPSGLRELNNYVANGALDNTTLRVYGGDLYGNIWRFDVNDNLAPVGKEATLVATAKDASGVAQPITTRLQLAEVNGNTMVVAATGQLLGSSDTSTTQVQSIYGFVDLLAATSPYTDLRGSLRTVSLTKSGTTRSTSCSGSAANCALTNGWVVDLPDSGERINVDPFIVAGTLVFVSNVPSNSACQAGGYSWINFLGLLTGLAAASSPDDVASMFLADSLSVGVGFVVLPDGRVIATSVGSDASVTQKQVPVEPPNPIGRRVSWREIKK
ncbi:hypothetical protein DIC66_06795 [Rhodoferax lacus]|uniref:PilY1 beta-propeller domain-containing protein n=2 Tax=Rhodoferax lacus TaxID=2184758 RepID=A0A3E1RDX3_9BURK|nr:hypothetical protein DIC66_06795 [Rhodoferax lacus]